MCAGRCGCKRLVEEVKLGSNSYSTVGASNRLRERSGGDISKYCRCCFLILRQREPQARGSGLVRGGILCTTDGLRLSRGWRSEFHHRRPPSSYTLRPFQGPIHAAIPDGVGHDDVSDVSSLTADTELQRHDRKPGIGSSTAFHQSLLEAVWE